MPSRLRLRRPHGFLFPGFDMEYNTHHEVYMRTNIVIDDQLVADAMKLSGARTKREVVELALRRLVSSAKQKDILDLVGQDMIAPGYDVRAVRSRIGTRATGAGPE